LQEAQVPITFLAQSTSDNAPGGAVLTFAFPVILFAIIAVVLYYLLFARPHPRVPSRRIALASSAPGAPEGGAAHAAAVAAGLPTASGGGAAESASEPAGAKRDTLADAADGDTTTTGSVSGSAANDGAAGDSEQADGSEQGTEASE
jgi:hypothetical protein